MAIYKAPLRDMRFLMHEVFDYVTALRAIPAYADLDRNLIDQILEEAAKFAENELLPINRSGDQEGCTLKDGEVTTPRGFPPHRGGPTMCVGGGMGTAGLFEVC